MFSGEQRALINQEYIMISEFSVPTEIEGEYDFVRDGDVILIVTANHSYQFAVSDSEGRCGLLSGGTLGERKFNAITSSSLQEGYGVTFHIGSPGSCYRMVTSDVKELICVREGERASREFIKFPGFVSATESPHIGI
jgi:hypothetical protein